MLGAASSPAGAAIVSGSNLASVPNGGICAFPVPISNCTYSLASLPLATQEAGGATVSVDGVIVSWKIKTGPAPVDHTVRLRVIDGNEGAATGPPETLPEAAGIYSYPARISVTPGEKLGVDFVEVPELAGAMVISVSVTGASFERWNPALADEQSRAPDGTEANTELLLNATIELDADNDGWGDESQDKCPGTTGGAEGCPIVGPPAPIPTEPVPQTTIAKGPKGKIQAHKATFRFTSTVSGSVFQCKLDHKPFKPCKSPKTYKGLAAGKHVFKVRASGPTGVPDPTPATRRFKVAL